MMQGRAGLFLSPHSVFAEQLSRKGSYWMTVDCHPDEHGLGYHTCHIGQPHLIFPASSHSEEKNQSNITVGNLSN